ncbi:MAG: transcription termination factor Rho, partial [Phycisphaerales bacterium]|nr:transcription termination factor Rho [Phycisphaerales bacterium]
MAKSTTSAVAGKSESTPRTTRKKTTRKATGDDKPRAEEAASRSSSSSSTSSASSSSGGQSSSQNSGGGNSGGGGGGGGDHRDSSSSSGGGHQGGHQNRPQSGGGGGGGGGDQGQGKKRRKKKKKRPGSGGPGGQGPSGSGSSGIPSSVLPNDADLDREAAELEQIVGTREYKEANKNAVHIAELQKMPIEELHTFAEEQDLEDVHKLPKQDLIFQILKKRAAENELMFGEGTLEVMPEGYGFLRSPECSYLAAPDDIYVSPSQIRRMGLRKGMEITGAIRPPRENERYFALLRVDSVNGREAAVVRTLPIFEDLTPLHPEERYVLETEPGIIETRVIDLVAPIGRGQRGLIVAPPRTGKTVLLQRMTRAISQNYPGTKIIVLLIDERPEEVTDFRRNTAEAVEVVASTFDEDSGRHVQVAEMVIEKARRWVEFGEHVVILLDS